MTTFRLIRLSLLLILTSGFTTACGSGSSTPRQVPVGPTAPSGQSGGSGTVTLTAPTVVSPVNGEQLATLRPTLVVQNGTSSNQSGTRTYQFQVSDRADFSLGASLAASFLVAVDQAGVPEGDGRTSFTVPSELQPTTRMYWRARMVQGTTTTDWTPVGMFKTKLVGYNRPGELYDPLVHGETVGLVIGSAVWISGKGLQLTTEDSYVQYELRAPITSGEFSVEVEGLHPNGPDHKLKIFSMSDSTADITNSNFQMSTMYRGVDGNPPNCIAFKAVFGSQSRIVEPDRSLRNAGIRMLDPSRTYFWKATWASTFRLLVLDGGVNGNSIYDLDLPGLGGTYRPVYAFLGSNQSRFGSDAGTFPGATYRHLWIGDKPRPSTLGNALD